MNKTEFIGSYSVPDGYFGDRAIVYVVLDNYILVHVTPDGSHKSAFLPMNMSHAENARWMIENHPNGKKYYKRN